MANSLGSASLILTTNPAQLNAGLDAAQAKVASWANAVQAKVAGIGGSVLKGFSSLSGSAIAGPLGAMVGVISGSIGDIKDKLRELGDSVKGAKAFGLDISTFSQLQHGLKLDPTELTTGLKHISEKLQEAKLGNQSAITSFSRLGISMGEISNMSLDQVLMRVSSGLNQLGDPAAAMALGLDLMGRSSQNMVGKLAQGTGAINANINAAREMGLVLSNQDGSKIEAANKAWSEMKRQIDGVWTQITVALAPAFESFAKAAGSVWKILGPIVTLLAKIAGFVFSGLAKGLEAVYGFFAKIADKAKSALQSLGIMKREVEGGNITQPREGANPNAAVSGVAALNQLTADVRTFEEELRKSNTLVGKSANEIKLWELAQRGASATMLRSARALSERNEMLNEAFKLNTANQDPYEKLTQSMDKLKAMLDAGLISAQVFGQQMLNNLKSAEDTLGMTGASRTPTAMQAGSKEAVKAILQHQTRPSEKIEDRMQAIAREQLNYQRKMAEGIAQFNNNFQGQVIMTS